MIRIAIAEDMHMLRDSLKFMIESNPEMQVVGLAQNGKEILSICETENPDLIVMDLKMPEMDGFETTKLIKSKYENVKIMILSTFNDEESVAKAVQYGADGYITKDLGVLELHQAIKSVHIGLRIFQNEALSNFARKNAALPNDDVVDIDISDKEKLIIKLIADGKSYKEIGSIIHLSEGTIRNILYNLLRRFNLNDRIQLVAYAAKNRII
jgi:DNA-binding NarL/FixJ family response regulator